MVAAAVLAAGVVSAGVGYAASSSAANKQVGAANTATNLQQGIYNQNQANLNPYMQTGSTANTQLSSMLAPGGQLSSNFTSADYLANQDPGYQFQLQQGQQALQNSQAATNGVLSGSAMKDLVNYNQGVASTGYQNAFNRWQTQNTNVYNRLMGQSQLGENAAAGAGNTGASIGANMSSTITGAGNAAAAGTVGGANAVTGAVNNATGYYMLNSMLNPTTPAPAVGIGSNPDGYNGTINNPSAYVG